MKKVPQSLLPHLWDDPEVELVLKEAEEELKKLSPLTRRELFGTDWLPPSPDEIFSPVDWEADDVQLF